MKAIHVSVQLFLVILCVLLSDEKKMVQGISTTQNVTFIFFQMKIISGVTAVSRFIT